MHDQTRIEEKLLPYIIFLPLFGRAFFPIVRDPNSITLQSSLADPQIVGMYILWAYCLYCFFREPGKIINALTAPLRPFTLFTVIVALSALIVSRSPMYSLWRSVETCGALLWGVLMLAQLRKEQHPSKLFVSYYAMTAIMLLGVVGNIVVDPEHSWRQEKHVERLAATSTFLMGANSIGVTAALLSLAALARFMVHQNVYYLIGACGPLVLCYAARSRTGFIMLGLGLLVLVGFLLRMPNRRVITAISAMLFAVLIIGLLLVSPEFVDTVEHTFTRGHDQENLSGLDGRVAIWEQALNAFVQSPVYGSGYASYPVQIIRGQGHFHNMFIELVVTTGLLGLLPMLVLFAQIGNRLVKLFLLDLDNIGTNPLGAIDALLIGCVVLASEATTAGAAYYSWEMIGVIVVTVGLFSMSDVPIASNENRGNLPLKAIHPRLISQGGGIIHKGPKYPNHLMIAWRETTPQFFHSRPPGRAENAQ